MAELVVIGSAAADLRSDDPGVSMRFYCWPHRTTHEFGLEDVEKIVYALGAEAVESPDDRADAGTGVPTCLRFVLDWAGTPEVFREHVEQGIECRERTDG